MRNHATQALFLATALLAPRVGRIYAQVPTAVDTIRITPANTGVPKLLEFNRDSIAAANISLLDLLELEYRYPLRGLRQDQLAHRFDITGRIDPPGISDPEHDPHAYRFLLDTLLKNHFDLVAHQALEAGTAQELVIASGGIKFRPSNSMPHCRCDRRSTVVSENRLTSSYISMSTLAARLSQELHLQIRDTTGLQGAFVIDLKWPPEAVAPALPPGVLPPLPRPLTQTPEDFLRKALETQLGLTLRPTQTKQLVVEIDNIETPASAM
ncbi:MAG TPA: TIGR03435 family protein [Candidatus Aquilonibacter sp.]|nr:TIGR03435 family protein [Candidatus Aquilonibacter sp.]